MRFFAAPLGHKVTALLLAMAVAGGLHTWFRHKALDSSSAAELSFDADVARHINPAAADGNQPAVTVAQSMLSDDVVQSLSKQAYLAAADMPGRVSEFRSRLELTQPSAQVLDVRFKDADPAKSIDTANAVANALSAWAPSTTPTPAPKPVPVPAPKSVAAPPAPAPAPVKKPVAVHHDEAGGALAAALGELEGQLAATSRKADGTDSSSSHYGGHSSSGYGRSSYAQSEEQQALKSGVRTALKKIDDLRAQYANGDAGPQARERLGAIREALREVLSGGGGRYRAAGVSASQLREERAQLTRAIGVVTKQRQAIAHEAAAEAKPETDGSDQAPAPAPAASAPTPAPVAPPAASAPSPDASTAPTNPPASSPSDGPTPDASVVGPSSPGPLRLLRLAGSPAPTLWWPSALAGLVCGLLYWSVAAWPSRTEDEAGYGDETPHFTGRFITPDEPVALKIEPAPPPLTTPVADYEVPDRAVYKRASFSYDPSPGERHFAAGAPLVAAEPLVEKEGVEREAAKLQSVQTPDKESLDSVSLTEQAGITAEPKKIELTPPQEKVQPAPAPEPLASAPVVEQLEAVPAHEALPVEARANPEPAPVVEKTEPIPVRENPDPAPVLENSAPIPVRETLDPVPVRESLIAATQSQTQESAPVRENVVEMADPWAELMKKALSETEIGRRFEGPPKGEAAGKDKEQVLSRPDRLAG
ncbi:MAG TPA: hypothetical protein VHZ25_05860 [Acidobacteriaceae bacterium]|jgi:hypothetical protein|nr:hypothetical protein [Acidobacteriaceae bacterium]